VAPGVSKCGPGLPDRLAACDPVIGERFDTVEAGERFDADEGDE
jgi:hypothetical protein